VLHRLKAEFMGWSPMRRSHSEVVRRCLLLVSLGEGKTRLEFDFIRYDSCRIVPEKLV